MACTQFQENCNNFSHKITQCVYSVSKFTKSKPTGHPKCMMEPFVLFFSSCELLLIKQVTNTHSSLSKISHDFRRIARKGPIMHSGMAACSARDNVQSNYVTWPISLHAHGQDVRTKTHSPLWRGSTCKEAWSVCENCPEADHRE